MGRQSKGHWIIISVALSQFVFAAVDLCGWFLYHGRIVALTEQDPIGRRVFGVIYQSLSLLPTMSLIFWLKFALSRWLERPILQFGTAGLIYHLVVAGLSVLLGLGLLRMREWARWSLAGLCVLAVIADLHLLAATTRMAHGSLPGGNSPGLGTHDAFFHAAPPLLGAIAALALLVLVLCYGHRSETSRAA
jgi:hypothetical protein